MFFFNKIFITFYNLLYSHVYIFRFDIAFVLFLHCYYVLNLYYYYSFFYFFKNDLFTTFYYLYFFLCCFCFFSPSSPSYYYSHVKLGNIYFLCCREVKAGSESSSLPLFTSRTSPPGT